jgi:TPR repeat protein
VDAVADSLRQLLELGTQHRPLLEVLANAAGILTAIAGAITAAFFAFRWLARKLRNGKPSDPDLSDPPLADGSLTRYSARAVELLGRDEALARLRAFLLADGGFLWMQIAGVGGQGKSRLGWELILAARDDGWRAGLLELCDLDAFAAQWATWRPRRPHLLVLDYVIGREAAIKPLLQTLAGRAEALRKPVRLLLLERQRWDRGGLPALEPERTGERGSGGPTRSDSGDGRAEWFLRLAERPGGNDPRLEITRFEDGLLELERLPDADLVAIVRKVAKKTRLPVAAGSSDPPKKKLRIAAIADLLRRILSRIRRSFNPTRTKLSEPRAAAFDVALTDDAITAQLRHIDSDGRPLYAYFLGQALADGADPGNGGSGPGWRRDDLLNATLERDRNTRWRECLGTDAPCLGDNSPAERLAVIATIAGGLNCPVAARQSPMEHANADARRRVLVLADGPLGTGVGGPSQVIPPLMPDLLGAWLVLSACRQGLNTAELLDIAWRLAPEQTAAFLQRVSQDFPEHAVAAEMLAQAPPDEPAAQALAAVAAAVLSNLFKARRAFPRPIMAALIAAAEGGDPKAMTGLGYCYWAGQGVELDPAQALAWYRKGAEAGDGQAMANLGVCYQQGIGVEPDPALALSWYRKGAEAGDGRAMANLGLCYDKGIGTEPDPAQALAWYRKGAEAGDGRAMTNLGWCYQQGIGIEPDPAQALAWCRKGAEAGDGLAMANLGFCYRQGIGVERDPAQALAWYRKGAEAGDASSMANLGFCYQQGIGVEPDPAQALAWYRKGAEAGDERARRHLRTLETTQALLAGERRGDPEATSWARTAAAGRPAVDWQDGPPLPGDWQDLTGTDAVQALASLYRQFADCWGGDVFDRLQAQRLRRIGLAFYSNCEVLDLQLQRPGRDRPELCSALVSPGGAALLDGTSALLHAINPRLLRLADDDAASDYLRFFCAFVRGEEGPIQIIDSLEGLSPSAASTARLADGFRSPISPLLVLDGDLETDGWRRFEGCVLYGNAIVRATFKVFATGTVELEGDQEIAANLPIRTRRYDGIFRTPLLDPAQG